VFAQEKSRPLVGSKAVIPKVGTTFIKTHYLTDSSGALMTKSVDDSELPDDTQIVVRVGARAHGRSECVEITGPQHADTNIYSFAKGGDIYFLNTNHPKSWTRLPFGLTPGKIIKTEPVADTGTTLGHHYDMMAHREMYVVGHDTSSIAGKNYDCIKLRLVEVKLFEGVEYREGATYWYAPELGYFIRLNFGWGGSYFMNEQVKSYLPG
jgi:hypothetical protein